MSAKALAKDIERPSSRDQGRVLLITDDPRLGACAEALEGGGFFVAGVAGGAKALIALQRTRPHVVIAHSKLKGISAGEMARILSEAQDAVPFVLVGEEGATNARRVEAMRAGASDLFQLPHEV